MSATADSPGPADAPAPTRIEPPVTDVSRPFWDATREQRFLVQWCIDCEQPIFYPREVCPSCLGTDLEWRPSAGTGTVYAVSVQHRPAFPTMADRVPYAVALIDLDDGIRLMSNVVECDPETVAPGLAVTVRWELLSDGRHLPQFRPG
ncbi:MAG: DNA-binding protein [Acidimicrobiales bacterium]|nr:DNA-binding protein [Acidimicrobiales bacterium]